MLARVYLLFNKSIHSAICHHHGSCHFIYCPGDYSPINTIKKCLLCGFCEKSILSKICGISEPAEIAMCVMCLLSTQEDPSLDPYHTKAGCCLCHPSADHRGMRYRGRRSLGAVCQQEPGWRVPQSVTDPVWENKVAGLERWCGGGVCVCCAVQAWGLHSSLSHPCKEQCGFICLWPWCSGSRGGCIMGVLCSTRLAEMASFWLTGMS